MPMTLLSLLKAQGMCQEALDLERSNVGVRAESTRKCREDENHDLWYRPGPPAEFRRVSLEWAAKASSAMAASTGCTRNAVGSSA